MGGYGSWELLRQRPAFFAAAVPINGVGTPAQAPSFSAVPIWNFHAADDPTVPVLGSRSMVDALRASGGKPIYTEYASGGHGIWPMAYGTPGLVDWTLAQRRRVPATDGPTLVITNQVNGSLIETGADTVDLAGIASTGGEAISQVRWTNQVTRASGTSNWVIKRIPIQISTTNTFTVIGSTISYAPNQGGSTTFSDTVKIRRVNTIRADISVNTKTVTLSWMGGLGPFRIQHAPDLVQSVWSDVATNVISPIVLPKEWNSTFYRILGH